MIGDDHQPNSRGLYTHYKDSLLKVGGLPSPVQGVDRPWHIGFMMIQGFAASEGKNLMWHGGMGYPESILMIEGVWTLVWTSVTELYLRSTPHPVTVTTRIITFLVGKPYKPPFATVTGWGVDPNYILDLSPRAPG